MMSSFVVHLYTPESDRAADSIINLLMQPSDWMSTLDCERICFPSLNQWTCPVESDISHCRTTAHPASMHFLLSVSRPAENLTGGAIDILSHFNTFVEFTPLVFHVNAFI